MYRAITDDANLNLFFHLLLLKVALPGLFSFIFRKVLDLEAIFCFSGKVFHKKRTPPFFSDERRAFFVVRFDFLPAPGMALVGSAGLSRLPHPFLRLQRQPAPQAPFPAPDSAFPPRGFR